MSVKIVFLGALQDLAGRPEMEVEGQIDWDGLLAVVDPRVAEQIGGDRIRVACNGRLLADKSSLAASDGDEVALLPPVSGG